MNSISSYSHIYFVVCTVNASNKDYSCILSYSKQLALYHTAPAFNDPEKEDS